MSEDVYDLPEENDALCLVCDEKEVPTLCRRPDCPWKDIFFDEDQS